MKAGQLVMHDLLWEKERRLRMAAAAMAGRLQGIVDSSPFSDEHKAELRAVIAEYEMARQELYAEEVRDVG